MGFVWVMHVVCVALTAYFARWLVLAEVARTVGPPLGSWEFRRSRILSFALLVLAGFSAVHVFGFGRELGPVRWVLVGAAVVVGVVSGVVRRCREGGCADKGPVSSA
jgi:hypothetical protein